MKILWIVNTIFPYPSEQLGLKKTVFGGWLNGLADKLKDINSIQLAIATTYNGKELKEFQDGKITYYLLPGGQAIKYKPKMEKYWKQINEMFKPDLVHIHGTEYSHGLAFINACPKTKVITAIQGLVSVYADVYYANLGIKEILKNITIRDILKMDNLFQQKKKFIERGRNEIEIIKKSNAIIGRTTWDYANCKAINNQMKYYHLDETLRETFYDSNIEWNINKIERETLYFSQATYPIKGFHILLDAINILKKEYPNIKVYVAGSKIIGNHKIRRSGYAKIIENKIKKYQLENKIVFMGTLDENQVKEKLLKSHIFVSASAIENESNSLTEAAILGMPTVSSYVGGIPDRVVDGKNGLLYPFTEPAMLANCIREYLKNDGMAISHGKEARRLALQRNKPDKNVEKLLNIYGEQGN